MKKTILLISLSIMTIGINAITRTVRVSGGDYTSVSAAVKACSDGDVVDVSGDFTEDTILVVNKSITIQGAGTNNTSIMRTSTAPNNNTKRLIQSTVAGKSLVIKNLTLKQDAFTGTDVGMGIHCMGATSSLTVENVVFNGFNSGIQNCAALWANNLGSCSVVNCEFINNTTSSLGGAIWITGPTTGTGLNKTVINQCTFEGNNASNVNSGHAICMYNVQALASIDSILIKNCTFFNNGAVANTGSTIRLMYHGARIGIKNCTFANNNSTAVAGDIFTNTGDNTIASKLALVGNLFYKGSLIVNSSTATVGTHTQWTGWVNYNFSTGGLTAGTYMTKAGNVGSLTPDASAGIQVEYDAITGKAILAKNGGVVRTIKLLGTSNTENKAINAVPLIYKQSALDGRGYTRKATTSDAGAYESEGLASNLFTPTMSNTDFCYYNNHQLHFVKPLSGVISVMNLNGTLLKKIILENAVQCNLDNLMTGVYLITITGSDLPMTNKICLF